MKTTMCMIRRVKGVFLFLLLLIASNTMAFAGKPPVVTTRPIDYNIQYFTAPNGGAVSSFEDMNSSGAVVGNYFTDSIHVSGYLYDPLVSVTKAIDLRSLVTMPAGSEDWYITYPRSINNFGAIVTTVWHATEGERAMLLDPNGSKDATSGKWIAVWLPDLPGSTSTTTMPLKINDHGDILLCASFYTTNASKHVPYVFNPGIYVLEDAFAVVELGFPIYDTGTIDMSFPVLGQPLRFAGVSAGRTASFRYTLGGALETFPMQDVDVFSINGYGTFCGRQTVSTIGRGGKAVLSPQTFRVDSGITTVGTGGRYALDINNSHDIVTNGKSLTHNSKVTVVSESPFLNLLI